MAEAKNIYARLIEARKNFKDIKKDQQVAFHGRNYKYADLSGIHAAIDDALAKAGLAVMQPISTDEHNVMRLTTKLVDEAGECIETSVVLNPPEDMQRLGAMLTYMRRYCLASFLSLVADEDTDGEGAAKNPVPKAKPAPEQKSNQLKKGPTITYLMYGADKEYRYNSIEDYCEAWRKLAAALKEKGKPLDEAVARNKPILMGLAATTSREHEVVRPMLEELGIELHEKAE